MPPGIPGSFSKPISVLEARSLQTVLIFYKLPGYSLSVCVLFASCQTPAASGGVWRNFEEAGE